MWITVLVTVFHDNTLLSIVHGVIIARGLAVALGGLGVAGPGRRLLLLDRLQGRHEQGRSHLGLRGLHSSGLKG